MMEITTLAYLERDGKYLMLHRTKKQGDLNHDKYIGVGGHVEHGESPEDCIKREILEETGLRAQKLTLRGILTFVMDEVDEYTFLFTCSDFSGTMHPCDEGELEWIPKEEIKKLPLWAGDHVFLRLLEEREDVFSCKLTYEQDVLVGVQVDGVDDRHYL